MFQFLCWAYLGLSIWTPQEWRIHTLLSSYVLGLLGCLYNGAWAWGEGFGAFNLAPAGTSGELFLTPGGA